MQGKLPQKSVRSPARLLTAISSLYKTNSVDNKDDFWLRWLIVFNLSPNCRADVPSRCKSIEPLVAANLPFHSKFYSDSSAFNVKISKWENYFRTWLCAKSRRYLYLPLYGFFKSKADIFSTK
jgi:hypothetical protein